MGAKQAFARKYNRSAWKENVRACWQENVIRRSNESYRISSAHGLNLMYLFEGKINYQARNKIISGLVKRVVEDRGSRFTDYLRLLTCMQDPGFEKLIFGIMESMLEKCSEK